MRSFLFFLGVFLVLFYIAVGNPFSSAINVANVTGEFGDPIPGLGSSVLNSFERGKEVFTTRFGRSDGLGPHFNAVSCFSCHEDPAAGGSSQRYRDFYMVAMEGPEGTTPKPFVDCTEENAPDQNDVLCLPSIVVPHYGPMGTIADPVDAHVEHPPIPPEATIRAVRNAPPLFGIGLFRLVSDEEILSRADPDDGDMDGISGRVNIITNEEDAIGRFGYKCQTASIEAFNRGALHNQMGITTDSTELVSNIPASPEEQSIIRELLSTKTAHAQVVVPKDRVIDYDDIPDPELGRLALLDLLAFQENLAAPRRGPLTAAVGRGETVFDDIGCTSCHVTSIETSIGLIHPFTDLLLHDLGVENGDGIVMDDASGTEFRTQPLWGLCEHFPFMHDGGADTVEQAILRHGGEAETARSNYENLNSTDKADLHRFLESL